MRAAVLRRATAALLLLASLVAAPAARAQEPPGAAEARGTALAARRAAAARIAFGDCPEAEGLPASVRCGTVTVPLDYAHPDGERLRLTVSRAAATGRDPDGGGEVPGQGALVFNPGGPGASGLYFPLAGMVPAWKRLAAAYDLVGYAPRGVAPSAPLSCQRPEEYFKGPRPAPAHPSAAYKRQRAAEAERYARDCAERAGDALRHYHSLNNARDLEVIRAALGERRLTFMGASYGTYLGTLYAGLFPSRVRRMVFDSVVDPRPEHVWYGVNLAQSAAFERRWSDVKRWIARHDAVYGLGDTPREVQGSYERAAAALAREPAGGTVGPAQLQGAFLGAGYYDDYWPHRAEALSAYLRGDPQPLIDQAGTRPPEAAAGAENAGAVYTAVECNDAPWPTDFRVWDRDNTRLARTAPFETWDNVWTNLPCAFWRAPRQLPLDVRTAPGELPPTLILAAERDAAAPYAGALELRRRLAGSVLVTERGAGSHGVAGGPNVCVNAHLEAYLLDGRVPARDVSCAPRPEPRPRPRPREDSGAAGRGA
ncbi:alpha/beta hydrolase [Streptomyces sp. SHP 1-2]|uniref:alpha/beta hydrolase n=1 Tax=Streptomyces sp. SHP 1-2 TaxID=2769489 RepID=UPI002236F56E|nr:alpha/beta hydrolase [Streptomyces sp. SHP 1-2]MCW5252851.1 alpha/beta fold hydrolase [Streptomyces sp. SHP 1-2]